MGVRRSIAIAICAVLSFVGVETSFARETNESKKEAPTKEERVAKLCQLLTGSADGHALPHEFFIRLVWVESRFNPDAVSPKGAQGIAQFMPGTAKLRGLQDPFDPSQALPASAHFLRDLKDQFGNWGLAAAGYNAGPGRVARWLAGQTGLPFETQNFVMQITGRPAEVWRKAGSLEQLTPPAKTADSGAEIEEKAQTCPTLVAALGSGGSFKALLPVARWQPWGAAIAADFSRSRAISRFKKISSRLGDELAAREPMLVQMRNRSRGRRSLFSARFGADTRIGAERICAAVRAKGAGCVPLRN